MGRKVQKLSQKEQARYDSNIDSLSKNNEGKTLNLGVVPLPPPLDDPGAKNWRGKTVKNPQEPSYGPEAYRPPSDEALARAEEYRTDPTAYNKKAKKEEEALRTPAAASTESKPNKKSEPTIATEKNSTTQVTQANVTSDSATKNTTTPTTAPSVESKESPILVETEQLTGREDGSIQFKEITQPTTPATPPVEGEEDELPPLEIPGINEPASQPLNQPTAPSTPQTTPAVGSVETPTGSSKTPEEQVNPVDAAAVRALQKKIATNFETLRRQREEAAVKAASATASTEGKTTDSATTGEKPAESQPQTPASTEQQAPQTPPATGNVEKLPVIPPAPKFDDSGNLIPAEPGTTRIQDSNALSIAPNPRSVKPEDIPTPTIERTPGRSPGEPDPMASLEIPETPDEERTRKMQEAFERNQAKANVESSRSTPAENSSTVTSTSTTSGGGSSTNLDIAANLQIHFTHVPTQKHVQFLAFLETFNDSYDAEWSSEKVFGRMDPIAQYKGTSRKINCSFTIPSDSHEEAYINHKKISLLINMMYPTYTEEGTLQVYQIAAPPLMIVKFNNLIRSAVDRSRGLLGYIPSIKYEPDMNSPIFLLNKNTVSFEEIDRRWGPKWANRNAEDNLDDDFEMIGYQSLKLTFELNVLHTHKLGFVDNKPGQALFPYGFNILNNIG